MITRPIYVLTKLFFLQLYPAYLSYKSIKHNQQQQQQQQYSPLIIYWMVVSLYLAIEYITDIFLFWFPFYYEIKLVIVLWLLPQTNGTEVFYKQYIDPFLSSHEALIDQTLIDIQAKVKSRVSLYWQNMVQFLRTFISDSFFKSFAESQPPAPPPPPAATAQRGSWSPYGIFTALMTTTQNQLTTTLATPSMSQEPTPLAAATTTTTTTTAAAVSSSSSSSAASSETSISLERVDSFDSLGSIEASNNNHARQQPSSSSAAAAAGTSTNAPPLPAATATWSGYVSSWIWKPQAEQKKTTKQD